MRWRIVNHSDLARSDLLRIAELKNQHWPYGIDSQIGWIKENILDGDAHLIGEDETDGEAPIKAYITLSQLQVDIDSKHYKAIGIGGVCVDKGLMNRGLGRVLVTEANRVIQDNNCLGILLCKDGLVAFYEKCRWNLLKYRTAKVANIPFEYNIMLLEGVDTCCNITIDRNF